MARNAVQMQKGLSLAEFQKRYGAEGQCREALFRWRFPNRFVCRACGHDRANLLKTRALYQCSRCHHQCSLTAGTIFHGTKLPLVTWFHALYCLTQTKNGMSALELMRQLGVAYNTAWGIKHKMQVMLERSREKRLSGLIELDDAYLGGERQGGKRGRGAAHKLPFVAAVEVKDGQPVRIHLRCVRGFRKTEIARWAKSALHPDTVVKSDGLACFAAVEQIGCVHVPQVLRDVRRAVKQGAFKWANTVLGNLKNALRGTYHAFHHKHAPRYLAEFEYRFNRRFDLPGMIPRLAYVALRTPPMPFRLLRLAEDCA